MSVAGTKVDRTLEALEERFADDPVRSDLIHRTRRFKSSWIELAEGLVRVRREGLWRGWGHDSFETYATRELSLKQETVEKLTGSYLFLKNKAPTVLDRDGVHERIPSYQSVDFLRRAEERDDAPPEVMGELRKRVIDDSASHASVVKKFEPSIFPEASEGRDTSSLRNVATRLDGLLADTRVVEPGLREDVRRVLGRLLAALDVS